MANSPFYVQPGTSMGPQAQKALSGIGQLLQERRQSQEAMARNQQAQEAIGQALETGDPTQMAKLMTQFPEYQKQIEAGIGFKSDQTKKNAVETLRATIANKDNPVEALRAMDQRIAMLDEQGIDSADTRKIRDMLASSIQSGQDPSNAFMAAEMLFASLAPKEYEVYASRTGVGAQGKVGAQEILPDGTIIQSTSTGPRVYSPSGQVLSGPEAAEKIREAREYGVDIESRKAGGRRTAALESERELKPTVEGETTRAKEQAKLDVKDVNAALERAQGIREGLSTYDNMIAEIDAGASTSAYGRWGPAIKASTRRFENEARKLGLGVIASTTFGALSEAELNLAMETAVPKLPPAEMRQWIQNKKAAQEKLADELERYAIFRADGGTKAQWMQIQKDMVAEQQASQGMSQEEQALQWARNNPNDPRAAAILQKLGVQ